MMNKYVLFVLIQLLLHLNIGAQTLTKNQMLEDFDFLYGKLDSVNSRFAIVKAVTGTDILSDIREVRQNIDTVTCDAGFYDCLYRAITLCKDKHISFTSGYPYNNYDKSYINEAKNKSISLYRSGIYNKYNPSINPFQVYYSNGEYFVPDIYDNDFTYTILIPQKAKLLKINGLSIDEYVENWVLPISSNVRWDNKYKKYYVTTLISPQRLGQSDKFNVTYYHKGNVREVDIKSYKIKFPNTNGASTPKVLYLKKNKILYIRIPQMQEQHIENYKMALLKHKNKPIDKVVIDVRGNGGGSDKVWLDIIATIINKPIPYPQKLAFKDNQLIKNLMSIDNISYREEQVDTKPLVIDNNRYFCLVNNGSIDPTENSLKYDGLIYVLIDDKVFSSTLAFAAVCQNSDQLVTVGTPSGYFGGQGVRPLYFIMPNTKLIFRIEYCLDCTNVEENNWEDYFHDRPEVIVNLALDDIFKIRNSTFELYEEDFLYSTDPVFKKVLKLK